jgi:hypothetical protein
MKKQFQILAVTFISIVIVSCSKQGMEIPEVTQKPAEEISTSSSSAVVRDPLAVKLLGYFPFDGNLKDQTKQLADGISSLRGGDAIYGYDRKGIFKSALKFNGKYGVKLFKIPQQTNVSVSAWVRNTNTYGAWGRMIVKPQSNGIGFQKTGPEFYGTIEKINVASVGVTAMNDLNWHHFVATYDGAKLRIYKDGVLANTKDWSMSLSSTLENFFLGYWNNEWYEGLLDDLRFYGRTLSATDVQQLYNL